MIMIDGKEYIKKQVGSSTKIMVLTQGHVIRGDVEETEKGYMVRNAEVIRKWGTTEGIGELAKKHNDATPTIDPLNGLVFVERTSLIYSVDVEV